MTVPYPSSTAIFFNLAYRKLQAFAVPSVQTRSTSSVLPSSNFLATGLPAMATPTSLPSTAAPTANLPPTVGRLCRWY